MRIIVILPLVFALALTGALLVWVDAGYLLGQAGYAMGDLFGAREFSDVPKPTAAEQELFDRAGAVREFGIEKLGLADTRAYSRYKRVDREALVWVVSGVREFAWERYEWRYPLFGGLPYRGYYREADAAREAARLRTEGYDALYRRVTAFSFLGFLPDPLYSFALERSYASLSNLILHEMTHATLFVPGQGSFNENLATFVGNEGSRLYIERTYGAGSPEYERMMSLRHDQEMFRQEMLRLHQELVELYAAINADSAEERVADADAQEQKAAVFAAFQARLAAEYDTLFETDAFRWITTVELSNAVVDLYITYSAELDRFHELLARHDGSIPAMLEALRAIRPEIEAQGMSALTVM